LYGDKADFIIVAVPLHDIVSKLTKKDTKFITKTHLIHIPYKTKQGEMSDYFKEHSCKHCENYVSVFEVCSKSSDYSKKWYTKVKNTESSKTRKAGNSKLYYSKNREGIAIKTKQMAREKKIPPPVPSTQLQETIISNWCSETSPENFIEGGCAVCGQLVLIKYLSKLSEIQCNLEVLNRLERLSSSELIQ
jgi:hypothetical protein